MSWQCKVAPSLGGGFAGTVESAWGTLPYEKTYAPTVFFGMYGLPDFFAFRQHKGDKTILWAGSDITHLKNGYWLDDKGKHRVPPQVLARYLNEYTNYVENIVEHDELKKLGIESHIVPSFLGDWRDYELFYTPSEKPKVYASVSGDDFEIYKWKEIEELAVKHPDIEFHLYGNNRTWSSFCQNIVVHGRVSQEEMNREIKEMQGSLRLLDHDGCSEIVVKAMLWGQWVFSIIPYPTSLSPDKLGTLKDLAYPNVEGRNWFINNLNKYPWVSKKQ